MTDRTMNHELPPETLVLPERLSLPKDKIRVLLLEGINDSAVGLMQAAGYTNLVRLPKALDRDALHAALKGIHILGIRSRTQLDGAALDAADRLLAVGCFSVGTNQVDLDAARRRGVPVFNAPFSNTRSVAELVIGEIVMLLRRIVPRSVGAHAGQWDKSATGSVEVRGKTLGIVGYGNIGTQLSTLAEAMGMRVVFYDHTDKLRHGNTEPTASLADLLAQSDVVSLHVPETDATANMIGEAEIRAMKPGAYLINNARGTVVDLDALARALRDGHLAGAAVDVFPVEPGSNQERFVSPLQGLENVILTPHVGGSTEEAQERIGAEVARKLVDYSDIGSTIGAVNFPQVQLPPRPTGARFIHVQQNLPGMLNRLNAVFSSAGINIAGQFYQTDGEVGYVVLETDATNADAETLLAEIRAIPGTIRARLLYERR
ncbi:D-3-phosphoglycerate dehydrogenase [Methylobacterium cerastii]|uniref:D-3-phosphoglycerate dehydrogenase n=2 Tax=Methylobacterium cerastii TaxID=932741 RepID=A0ABQ4QIL8_9HYPH|nr:D-3-phosphoglycerate dehydrogenase [Methylobacterium cerastii]